METGTDPKPTGPAYYGYLFEPDRKPSKVLEALLRSVAGYIIEHIGDKKDRTLSPVKLAAFYKAVGGSYDSLFVEVPHPSISYIYQAVGCQHSLQPTGSDFDPPSIPALTTRGFVRWASIETLLGPEEHAPYIQFAVKNFDLKHPDTGEPFPADLPRTAFPLEPDPEIERWHTACAAKLKQEAASDNLDSPGSRPSLPLRTGLRSGYTYFRPPHSTGRSPGERREGADYFEKRPIAFQHVPNINIQPMRTQPNREPARRTHHNTLAEESPRTSRARGRSVPENYYPASPVSQGPAPSIPPRHGLPPRSESYIRRHSHPRVHRRPSISSVSSSDGDNDSSYSESESRRTTPHIRARRKGPPHTQEFIANLRVFPAGSTSKLPAKPSSQTRVRVDPRLANYKVPIDLSGKLSAPFLQSSQASSRASTPARSSSRNRNVRWDGPDDYQDIRHSSAELGRSGDDSSRDRRRQDGMRPKPVQVRSGSLDGLRNSREGAHRRRDNEKERNMELNRNRDRIGDKRPERDIRVADRRHDKWRYVSEGVRL